MREWLVRLLGGWSMRDVSEEISPEGTYLRHCLDEALAENRRLVNIILTHEGYIHDDRTTEEPQVHLHPIGGRNTWSATKARMERQESVKPEEKRPPESIETEKRWAEKVNAS